MKSSDYNSTKTALDRLTKWAVGSRRDDSTSYSKKWLYEALSLALQRGNASMVSSYCSMVRAAEEAPAAAPA